MFSMAQLSVFVDVPSLFEKNVNSVSVRCSVVCQLA